jgi:hypothetical protein
MMHPAHRWGPCDVLVHGRKICGCVYGLDINYGKPSENGPQKI